VDDYVIILHSSSLNITTGELTVQAWAFIRYSDSYARAIVNKEETTTGFNLYHTRSMLGIKIGDGSNNYTYGSTGAFTPHTWNNFALVAKSGKWMKGYLNGVEVYSKTVGNMQWNTKNVTIAVRTDLNSLTFTNGLISEVLIYNWALSPDEISWNYQNFYNPVRDGLVLCLIADPQYIRDIDGDGRLEWIDLSGYCITEDSRGFFDQGYVEVSMVSSGEKILTINGFSPIIRQYKRYYNGDVVVIGSRGFVVGLTPEHKVLVVPRKIVKTYRRTQSMRRWLKKDTHPPSFNPLWVPASEVNVWDYLVVPKPAFPEEEVFIEPFPKMHVTKKLLIFDAYLKGLSSREVVEKYGFKANTVRTYYTRWRKGQKLPERYVSVAGKQLLDEDWATIFGWYVAEGYVNVNSGKILFTLGPDEEEDAKQLVRLLRGKGLSPYFAKRKYSVTVGVSSKPFAHFLVENFGTGALQKKIPAWMFNAKTNIIQAFLKAYGKGDGWIRRKNKGKKYYSLISFQTASPKLVEGVTLLLMKLGIFPHIAPMNGRGVCTIMGKVVKQNPAWDIRVEGYDVLKLFDDLPVASQRKARYLQDDKFFYIPVTKKEIKHYNGYVYDFETKSHTLGMPFIIHNSNHGKIYGATLVDLFKSPARTLPAVRTLLPAR
jgi:intein/homing endonuclease